MNAVGTIERAFYKRRPNVRSMLRRCVRPSALRLAASAVAALAAAACHSLDPLSSADNERLETFDFMADPDPELYHVRAYTEHPAFAGVEAQLKSPQFIAAIQRTREASSV